MLLKVIGTGSSGNSYMLQADDGALILDAGMPFKSVLIKAGINNPNWLRDVEGVLVTHEHGDHAKAVSEWAKMGANVYATLGTIEALRLDKTALASRRIRPIVMLGMFKTAHFSILPFPTQHDAAEPCGYLIRYEPTGETVLYATDTYYLSRTFPNVNYWIVECNYIDEIADNMVDAGDLEKQIRNRLYRSHMSLDRLKQTLSANDLTVTRKIVLVHLSDMRSDERRMISDISALTGIDTVAAADGIDIPLELTPF